MIDLPTLRALACAASSGPWMLGSLESYSGEEMRPCRYFYRNMSDNEHTRTRVYGGEGDNGVVFDCDADAEYIAALNPQTVLEILAELEAAREVIALVDSCPPDSHVRRALNNYDRITNNETTTEGKT